VVRATTPGLAPENQRRRNEQASEMSSDGSVTFEENGTNIHQLLSELTLHSDDRADLLRRGFTQKQIDLAGFSHRALPATSISYSDYYQESSE
jgi:hypothetical protein